MILRLCHVRQAVLLNLMETLYQIKYALMSDLRTKVVYKLHVLTYENGCLLIIVMRDNHG